MAIETASASARAFVRSLNVLLKFARLYGLNHSRSAGQFDAAWSELTDALSAAGPSGLLLGVSASQLLLDGVPLEATPAERSFAELLTAVGVASISFNKNLTRDQFADFVRAFTGGAKASNLSGQLRTALARNGSSSIRVNKICFVAEDSSTAEAHIAAQIAARTLGADAGKLQDFLRDPQKLIQLIAAAEGADHSGPGSSAYRGSPANTGTGSAGGTGASGTNATGGAPEAPGYASGGEPQAAPGAGSLPEEEVLGMLRLLVQMGETSREKSAVDPAQFQEEVSRLPEAARLTMRQALAAMASSPQPAKPDEPMLVRLAEDLAIRFALDRYQRGEVRVNAVRQMLDRLGREVDTLRKMLHAREDKMAGAGMVVESHADLLDRQFWASVSESGKRSVLLSSEAWCVPPRNVQQFVEELFEKGDDQTAKTILRQYAACVQEKDLDGRRKAVLGLGQLAELYGRAGAGPVEKALRWLGAQMQHENDAELQTLESAAFVRIGQEAGAKRLYPALEIALDSLVEVEKARPNWVQGLRSRLGVENRFPEFIEEALTAPKIPEGLPAVLARLPEAAAEHLASRLSRCSSREERERLIELANALGAPCVRHLRKMLASQPPSKAVTAAGLLSRLDPAGLEEALPGMLPQWNRAYQDAVLRQLAIAGVIGRGRLLARLLNNFDPLLRPLVLDEVGLSGDLVAARNLLDIVEDENMKDGAAFLRVKAIEALGRLRMLGAVESLQKIAESKRAWLWVYPAELRMAAARALQTLDPDWGPGFLPHSGLDPAAIALGAQEYCPRESAVRIRRYPRVRPPRPVVAQLANQRGKYELQLKALSLGGGLLHGDQHFAAGSEAVLRIHPGFWSITARVIIRQTRSQLTVFEIVAIDLDERAKLRKLLVSFSSDSPLERPSLMPQA